MNYEIQCKWMPTRDWMSWASAKHIKRARDHVKALREMHRDKTFRLVRVTRKVVKG